MLYIQMEELNDWILHQSLEKVAIRFHDYDHSRSEVAVAGSWSDWYFEMSVSIPVAAANAAHFLKLLGC